MTSFFAEWDKEEEEKRARVATAKKLESEWKKIAKRKRELWGQDRGGSDWARLSRNEKIERFLVDSLKLSFKRIHVQYEDTESDIEHPFCLGIAVNKISFDFWKYTAFVDDKKAGVGVGGSLSRPRRR